MRSTIIIANWKLNGNWAFNEEFAGAFSAGLKDRELGDRRIVICPPSIYLQQMNGLLVEQQVFLGGQDLSDEISGAFTGEISGGMLKDFGCRYVIVGHSERRLRQFETNEQVLKKTVQAIASGITPIVCIGETLDQRTNGYTKTVLLEQVNVLTDGLGKDLSRIVLAYEPIWAIGTGENASSEQVQEVHAWLRSVFEAVDPLIAQEMLLIYGGSVKAAHAQELLSMPDIDGLLVGGASLVAPEFLSICLAGLDA
jgi:triosephosphate isomerase